MVEQLIAHSEIMLLVAQYLRKIPDIERLLGHVKASINSSAVLLLPLIGRKKLKQRVSFLRISSLLVYVCLFLCLHTCVILVLYFPLALNKYGNFISESKVVQTAVPS